MPTNGDKNDPKERRIRDMLGLVKFCLETTAKEDASGLNSSNIQPMDPDRRAWLQEAINSMTVDTTKQLLENLALVKETIVQLERCPDDHNIAVQKTCNAIEVLTDLCEEIDYASDFAKLDGFSIFKPLIGCSHEELIVKACELIAALAQNNPICQTFAMNARVLERLIDFVDIKDKPSHIKARSYALYAISSIIRSNQEVRTHFETNLDGLTVLLNVLDYQIDRMLDAKQQDPQPQSESPRTSPSKGGDGKKSSVYWWRKLKIRSIFLFRTLCSESSFASEFFFKKQAIKLITSQLEDPHDLEIREHLLHALEAFLTSLDSAKQIESSKLSPNLRDVVEQIHNLSLQESGDDYDMTDTRSTCKELMNLIDSFYQK